MALNPTNACISLWHWFRHRLPLWFKVVILCVTLTLISFLTLDLDLLVAPILKLIAFLKLSSAKFVAFCSLHYQQFLKKGLALIVSVTGSWEVWSAKKMIRHGLRAGASMAARFFVFNLFINLFFGKERKGIRNLPRLCLTTLKKTWLGDVLSWWDQASERTKRLATGLILCLVLVLAGQAFIGVSILVFDLVWELLIMLGRYFLRFWRWIAPLAFRLVPNAIATFFTQKVLPLFTEAVPMVRDDHRVIYARFDFRERYRKLKKRLLVFSRAKRDPVRNRLRQHLPEKLRQSKSRILDNAASLGSENRGTGNEGK